MPKHIDVAIIGGGLAGNCLARQLRLALPDISIAIFERSEERTYKVGEATVEIAANYFVRRLRLSTYLYKNHLPKNGLRFFFDTPERDGELTRLSELGTDQLPHWPSFQLDRFRLEADLIEMNRAADVDVHLGARVEHLDMASDGGPHSLTVSQGGQREIWRARWVVDASGRVSMLAHHFDLRRPEQSHRITSSFGRYHSVTDIDSIDAPSWHARNSWSSRQLSTNHFCYPGYWIWLIPQPATDTVSLGVVSESGRWKPERFKQEGFLSFLREHRALASLLEDAQPLHFGHFAQLPYRATRAYDAARWALVGEACCFGDPFYSPGSDFIALANDLAASLIERDFAGDDIHERVELYNEQLLMRFENALLVYDGLYPTFGSYELFKIKCLFDCSCYFNLWLDAYLRDEHLDLKKVRAQLRRKRGFIDVMTNMATLFKGAAEELMKRGTYYDQNRDHFCLDGRLAFGATGELGGERKRNEISARTEEIFNEAHASLTALVGLPRRAPFALADFASKPELFDVAALRTSASAEAGATVDADVVVIGAGPAGTSASSWLARQGRSVVCLESSFFPRHVIGESLLPRCNALLEEAGLLEAVHDRGYMVKTGALFIRGDERERFSFAESLKGDSVSTYQVPRDDFDQTLATAARGHGVDVRFGHRVEDVVFDDECVRISARDVSTGASVEVRAEFVIDCSGYGRVLPKLLGLERPSHLPRRISCFSQIEGDIRPDPEGDIWICSLGKNSWSWIIPFSNGRSSIGIVCDPSVWEAIDGTDAERLMTLMRRDESAAARLKRARLVTPTRVMDGYSKRVERMHGERWSLAGNASDFFDPVFSSGVMLALESGVLSAKLVDRELAGETVDWNREYSEVLGEAGGVFLAFIESWYREELQAIFFSERKSKSSKQRIASVLGGYVMRQDNPFVHQPVESLRLLHDAVRSMEARP